MVSCDYFRNTVGRQLITEMGGANKIRGAECQGGQNISRGAEETQDHNKP